MTTGTLRDLRILPMVAVVMPLPTELTTPPVTKMYLVDMYPLAGGYLRPEQMIQDARRGLQGCRGSSWLIVAGGGGGGGPPPGGGGAGGGSSRPPGAPAAPARPGG